MQVLLFRGWRFLVDQRRRRKNHIAPSSSLEDDKSTGEVAAAAAVVSPNNNNKNTVTNDEKAAYYGGGIALFHRDEIKTGILLGKGSFSKVLAVRDIQLKKKKQQQHDNNNAKRVGNNDNYNNNHHHHHRLSKRDAVRSKNAKYAIKHLRKSSTRSSDGFFSFAANDIVNEARMLALLDHEGIIKIHGVAAAAGSSTTTKRNHDDDGFFLIIDRISFTLDEQLSAWRRTSFAAAKKKNHRHKKKDDDDDDNDTTMTMMSPFFFKTTRISLQIADALAYMHGRRIVFRDLKPQNVGFREDGETVVIFDFGSCRELPPPSPEEETDSTHDGCYNMSIAGTPRYMAPEILKTKRYNEKADVYSWAVLFYKMIALQEKQQNHHHHPFPPPPPEELLDATPNLLPHKIERVLKGAWAHSVSERSSMEHVCTELRTILEDDDVFSSSNNT